MILNGENNKSKKLITTLSWVLLVGACVSQTASAANVDSNATFSATVLDSCSVNVTVQGVLQASSNASSLSSEETGGVAAVANIVTNSTNSTVSVINPTSFATAPSGADTNTTFASKYDLTGATTANIADGTVANALGTGATTMTLNASATKSSGSYGAGSYQFVTTIRCTTP